MYIQVYTQYICMYKYVFMLYIHTYMYIYILRPHIFVASSESYVYWCSFSLNADIKKSTDRPKKNNF